MKYPFTRFGFTAMLLFGAFSLVGDPGGMLKAAHAPARTRASQPHRAMAVHFTRASWYGPGFYHRLRKDGRPYEKNEAFIAHRTLPMGTVVRVVNLDNRRTLTLVVRDRMPAIPPDADHFPGHGRDIDLSYRAAEELGALDQGVVPVSYTILRRG